MAKIEDIDLLANYQQPNWLREALDATCLDPQFRFRCEEAADIALSLAKMRRERGRSQGFVDLSLQTYVEGLAELAEVDLNRILRWLELPDLGSLESITIRSAVRLCKEIGMSLREAVDHVRIGFAESQGFAPFSIVAAQRGSSDRGIERCEVTLAELETRYDLSVLHQIRELETAMHSAYREQD